MARSRLAKFCVNPREYCKDKNDEFHALAIMAWWPGGLKGHPCEGVRGVAVPVGQG